MAIKNAYFSTLASCRYIFKNGAEAPFINYVFYTNDETQIKELDAEIAAGNNMIYTKPEQLTVDTSKLDPLQAIKDAAIKEFLENQAAANKLSNDRGTSEKVKLNVASSRNVADAAASSGT